MSVPEAKPGPGAPPVSIRQVPGLAASAQVQQRESWIQQQKQFFNETDTGNEGSIDKKELLALMKLMGHSKMTEDDMARLIGSIQLDKDLERVSFAEFLVLCEPLRGSDVSLDTIASQVKATFKALPKALRPLHEVMEEEGASTQWANLGAFVDSAWVNLFVLFLVFVDLVAVLGEIFVWATLVNVCDLECDQGLKLSLDSDFIESYLAEDAHGAYCISELGFTRPANASAAAHRQLGSAGATCGDLSGLHCHMHCHYDPTQHEVEVVLHWVSIAALCLLMVQVLLQMIAYGLRFWKSPVYVIDFVVILVALVAESLPAGFRVGGLVVFLLVWRVLRVCHGAYTAAHLHRHSVEHERA